MKYTIEIEDKHLLYIGRKLDEQPHGEVAEMMAAIQAQITSQDVAARNKKQIEQNATAEAWRAQEREKLRAEMPPTPSWKPMESAPRNGKKFIMLSHGEPVVTEYRVGADQEWQWTHSGEHHLTDADVAGNLWTEILPIPEVKET